MSQQTIATRAQRRAGWFLAAAAVLLLANSLFLYSNSMPDGIVALMLQLHVWLGYAFSAVLLGFALPHVLLHARHGNRRARRIGIGLVAAAAAGSGLGVALHLAGEPGFTRWLLRWHQLLFVGAIAAYLAHRLAARATPVMRQEFAGAMAVVILAFTLWGVNWSARVREDATGRPAAGGAGPVAGGAVAAAGGAAAAAGGAAAAAGGAAAADFGATRARTVTGHWLGRDDLGNPRYCAQCHQEIARQWEGSAHRFSSLNDPFYLATFESLQRNRPPSAAKFCGGCHDPLITLTGNMEGKVTLETPNAEEGITCLACHAITEVRDRIGNAGYVVGAPDHYPFYGSKDPAEQERNRHLIRTKPEKHKQSFMKPAFRTSEFCLTCHKANLDVPVNHYRWKRGQNDYDAWFESSVAMKSARTYYSAKEAKRCQDCHMPEVATQDPAAKDGLTRDHTFAGANTALATVAARTDWLEKTRKSLEGSLSVDLLAAVADGDRPGERRLFPLEDAQMRLPAGRPVRVEVVVRNRKVGHVFPGGTTDLNEAWLELTVAGPDGAPILGSGLLDETRRLDPTAHRYHNVLLTREGRKLEIHEVEHFHTVLYNNALQLGNSDVVRYEFTVPELPEGSRLRLTARLHYRKFSRQYTEFALGPGARDFPIVEIAADEVEVAVGKELAGPAPRSGSEELAMRLNDYGIAHLRQGDARVAAWAFERVAAMLPRYADAHVNLARVHLREGMLPAMERALRAADRLEPGMPKTAYFLGRLRAAQGRFAEAVAAYDRALAAFPEDREVLTQKGIALFKAERFADATAPFLRVLELDPEDVTASSYLARACAALGDGERAQEYEARTARYRTEESERAVTEIHRRNDPHGDREANLQHVHPLAPVRPGQSPGVALSAR